VEPPPPTAWRWRAAVLLLLGGISATVSSVYAVGVARAYEQAVIYWVLGLLLCAAAMVVGGRRPFRLRSSVTERRVEIAAVVALLALAVALRFPNLETIPPEVHGDEAACALEGRSIVRGEVPNLFSVGWYHIPYLSFAISAASMRVFGDDLWGFRMASVIQGTLSVWLLYILGKRLFSRRVGFLAAALLAVSHWHIHFSRSGINYMQALFATLLVLVFVVRGIQERRALDWLLAGFAVGLCVNVYYAARLTPVLAALYLLHRIVFERNFLRTHWDGMTAMALGAVLFFAPMSVVFAQSPQIFMTRTEGVFLFTESNLHHAYYTYQVDSIRDVLIEQVTRTVEAFNWRGETSLQHNHKGPLIDFWSAGLFVVGVAAFSLRWVRARFFLLGTWFWLTLLLGSVLTVDSLFSPRVIILVPAMVLFPALVVDTGWRAVARLIGR
jgi:4-amino-4-deoxy-L-arabinose transferase-like glycosyltransferase